MKDQSVVRAESRSRHRNAANTDKFSTAPETEDGNLDGQVSLRPPCNNKNAVFANASGVKQSRNRGDNRSDSPPRPPAASTPPPEGN